MFQHLLHENDSNEHHCVGAYWHANVHVDADELELPKHDCDYQPGVGDDYEE
ncbi:hypothetical protein [Marinifilum fragile]|uniref:hypothetical protein n=1 Tax=Marinifilum fragile TaxID=570161 RepID=UPI002AA9321E|nr:hypothetical protein [Marinifilum fragile]